MAVEQVVFIGALTTHFSIKVQAAGGETTRFQDFVHHQRVFFNAVRELVGIPAQLRVAAVSVNGTKQSQSNGSRNFVMERMTGQRRVVRFDVQFDLFFQAELFQETIDGRSVVIILMFGWLLRFGFNQQRTLEANLVLVLNDQLHKAANLLALLTQIGIQQGFITFTAAPQDIVFAAQLVGRIHCGDHLSRRPAEHFRIRIGCRPGAIARVRKAVCRSPQQLDAALLLFFRQHFNHLRKVVGILFQRCPFRGNVNVVETVVRYVQFVEKLKRDIRFAFRHFQRFARLLPRAVKGAHAKHVSTIPAEGVPVAGRKAQVVLHPFAQHQFIRVVMTESQWVSGCRAFITNAIELIKIGLHNELHIQGCGE